MDSGKPIARRNQGAMIIYFPENGDTVWSIANRYSASVDEIERINNLENDDLNSVRMILIPVN